MTIMKFLAFVFLAVTSIAYSQNKIAEPLGPKGEHFVLYNKCLKAVTFCELTQQDYFICGASKNCYGLFVMPGDTFYVHIEDKNQALAVIADISFDGYLTPATAFTFQPIDMDCIPGALQIAIPLTAVPGSSFQIVAQNTRYVASPYNPGTPWPYSVYVGGEQPENTTALSDYTTCPSVPEIDTTQVSLAEKKLEKQKGMLYPNPVNNTITLKNLNSNLIHYIIIIYDPLGNKVLEENKSSSEPISVEFLKNGAYICHLVFENGYVFSEKIIVLKQ